MMNQTPNEPDEIGLFFVSDSHDFPMVYNFPMARMRKACPKGWHILEEAGCNIRLDGMDPLGKDESVAFQLIRNMLNGENNVIGDVKVPINTRMLFYMSELFVWLGSEEVHTIRRSYINRIFEALRILCSQPTPQRFQNAVADIDRDELNLMDTERFSMLLGMWPCGICKGMPADGLQGELKQLVPGFTSPGSYLGSVEALLNPLRQVEVNIRAM
ncbi:hypothetical protein CEP54_002247 [Fusarium duplospermum]|uniref:Uncharacterized protein n=1 Tax=Fusarium duplospermum TaxID=1325734 RepID=A0A428QVT2_9HYPO|nr:hypothetical protein CEP54_002247 [Fusarium duplospermum]